MRIRNQSRRSRAGRMAAMACAGALALSGCDFDVYSLPLPGGADLGDEQYSVKVEFRDVLDLVPQSSVKVNDVTVGKVTDIDVDGGTAYITGEGDPHVTRAGVAGAPRNNLLMRPNWPSLGVGGAPTTTGAATGGRCPARRG